MSLVMARVTSKLLLPRETSRVLSTPTYYRRRASCSRLHSQTYCVVLVWTQRWLCRCTSMARGRGRNASIDRSVVTDRYSLVRSGGRLELVDANAPRVSVSLDVADVRRRIRQGRRLAIA